MAKTKRFFISDIHLNSQTLYDDPKQPAWYNPEIHNPRLLGFLEKTVLAQKDQVKDLILLGDVFNTWVCPAKKVPPKYSEIFTANRPVLNMFKKIMKGTDSIVLPQQKKISIQALKQRFERLSDVYNLNELINDLYQRRYLNGPAERLCKRFNFNVVIFGHTHNAMLDKDWFFTEDRIYANTGCWCKPNAHCVEVD